MAFDVASEATWLRSRLESLAARPVWGESKIHLRIALPNIRQLVAERKAALDAAHDDEVGALADLLWNGVTYDEMALAVAVVRHRPSLVTRERLERWRGDLDGWGVTDDLASVTRAWVAEDPDTRFPLLDHLVGEPGAWTRRLALLSTVALAREGRATDRILALVNAVLDDVRPTVQRAVSTVLREAGSATPDPLLAYIEEQADRLPARTRIEVRNKIRTGRKDGEDKEGGPARGDARRGRLDRVRKTGGRTRRPPGRRKKEP
jgi:3-methyladenine DNA glycosylase AlkD